MNQLYPSWNLKVISMINYVINQIIELKLFDLKVAKDLHLWKKQNMAAGFWLKFLLKSYLI